MSDIAALFFLVGGVACFVGSLVQFYAVLKVIKRFLEVSRPHLMFKHGLLTDIMIGDEPPALAKQSAQDKL